MDIKTGNKIIAEFMGYKLITPEMRKIPQNWTISYWEKPSDKHLADVLGSENNLKYHSSWDWLMPVVKEINRMFWVDFPFDAEYVDFLRASLDVVWEACVNFIKKHNESLGNIE